MASSRADEKLYKGGKVERDVRNEQWFPRYFAQNETCLNNLFRRNPNVKVKMVGIQGCLLYGTATRFEWTALTEDINKTVLSGAIKVRHDTAPRDTNRNYTSTSTCHDHTCAMPPYNLRV